jgi:hypothetical protein
MGDTLVPDGLSIICNVFCSKPMANRELCPKVGDGNIAIATDAALNLWKSTEKRFQEPEPVRHVCCWSLVVQGMTRQVRP